MSDEHFDDLAREVFSFQFEHVEIYRNYCQRRGIRPADVSRWVEIPAVPTDAFKVAPLTCGTVQDAVATFRTSGTTRGIARRGTHHLQATDLYEAALLAGFHAHLLPDRPSIRILSLIPPGAEAPDSSLSFMIQRVMEVFGASGSGYFATAAAIDAAALLECLREPRADAPVLLAGTSLGFLHLLEVMRASNLRIVLPSGSRAMDTGGFKGHTREVPRDSLYASLRTQLGIPRSHLVNEYGMTEMSSQLYDAIVGEGRGEGVRRHVGPGWLRSVAVDPETLAPLPSGSLGILRHMDLANLYSVASLQTADLGVVTEEGVELRGRAVGAEARGCSIATEELLEAMQRNH